MSLVSSSSLRPPPPTCIIPLVSTSKGAVCISRGSWRSSSFDAVSALEWGRGCRIGGTSRRVVLREAEGEQGATAAVVEGPPLEPENAAWEAFVARVSGEWDGYSAEFNFQGEPVQLPSNVVPDAFREWGVEVHDWQIQCPTLAHPDLGQLWYKVIRLLPTVGCEADAATTHSVEECDARQNARVLAYHKGGSYTILWRGKRVIHESKGSGPGKVVLREGDQWELEQCLVHERTRVRILQQLGARRRVVVFRETWEGPFRNGESLGGCAATTSAFATQTRLQASALSGSWHSDLYSAEPQLNFDSSGKDGYESSELTFSGSEESYKHLTDDVLFLPKDLWTELKSSNVGGSMIETGWLVNADQAIVSLCEFESSGDFKAAHLRLEKRISHF